MATIPNRRRRGEILTTFELETLAHGRLSIPGSALVHLQFRRFSGCPVCNVQLRRFASAEAHLRAAGVLTVSLFYSTKEAMLPYQYELPQPVVADPKRQIFDAFGVERSPWAAASPKAWVTAIGGMLSGPTDPFEDAIKDGLPADVLIAPIKAPDAARQCQIIALHYGTSIDDQWSVDDVVELARAHFKGNEIALPFSHTENGERGHASKAH